MMLSEAFRSLTQQASDQHPTDFLDAPPLIAALNHADFSSRFSDGISLACKAVGTVALLIYRASDGCARQHISEVIFNVADLQKFICDEKTITKAIIYEVNMQLQLK